MVGWWVVQMVGWLVGDGAVGCGGGLFWGDRALSGVLIPEQGHSSMEVVTHCRVMSPWRWWQWGDIPMEGDSSMEEGGETFWSDVPMESGALG